MLTIITSGISHSDVFEVEEEVVADAASVICLSRCVLLALLGHSTVSCLLLPQRPYFLAFAGIAVMVNECVHLHRGTAARSQTILAVAAAHAVVVTDDLVKITPKIRVSEVLLVVVGTWCWSLLW